MTDRIDCGSRAAAGRGRRRYRKHGEFAKTGKWAWYIHKRISGFTEQPATPEDLKNPLATMSPGRDMAEFPEFYAEYFPTQGQGQTSAPVRYATLATPKWHAILPT